MKKLDLHIHTIPTVSDRPFDFSMESLKKYVNDLALDAIAILKLALLKCMCHVIVLLLTQKLYYYT